MLEGFAYAVVLGIGATALLDLWAQLLKAVLGYPPPNWGMVGRWFAHLPRGTFFHHGIGQSAPVNRELAIGWTMHYVVGIVFAAALLLIWGVEWVHAPRFIPAWIVGLVTVGAGWFILQPGMGAGVAASKTPNPTRARVLNIVGHTVFAIGLYGTALLINAAQS
ncbi:DUF2938 domain-containing protein [Alcaligenaceae bacterium A4P071]|nr:DUF2938 domain-containing protein [Alcaligenaceae bacterium B3P038]MDQ2186211.1 DUF2938 domain-containing protein [Alcaligenaceae bacterium A4P071]